MVASVSMAAQTTDKVEFQVRIMDYDDGSVTVVPDSNYIGMSFWKENVKVDSIRTFSEAVSTLSAYGFKVRTIAPIVQGRVVIMTKVDDYSASVRYRDNILRLGQILDSMKSDRE